LALAGTALAWAKPTLQTDCAPNPNSYAWWITLPGSEPNYNFDWTFHPDVLDPADPHDPDHWLAEGSGNAGGTAPFYFVTSQGGPVLYVRWSSDHGATNSAPANTELCEPEGEPSVDLDKFVWDEGGLVTEVTAGDPVTYTYEVTNDGEVNLDIALLEDLIVSSPEADPGDVACDDFDRQADDPGNDDETFEPGETWVFTCTVEGLPVGETENEACVYANAFHEVVTDLVVDPRDSDVDSCAEYGITVVEGGTGGGQGTPAQGSIPDTALSLSSPSSALATFAFAMLLVGALGALAFVNVKSSRR
jgi:hypothetical protein